MQRHWAYAAQYRTGQVRLPVPPSTRFSAPWKVEKAQRSSELRRGGGGRYTEREEERDIVCVRVERGVRVEPQPANDSRGEGRTTPLPPHTNRNEGNTETHSPRAHTDIRAPGEGKRKLILS